MEELTRKNAISAHIVETSTKMIFNLSFLVAKSRNMFLVVKCVNIEVTV